MSDAVVCPYCRTPFDENGPSKIYCTACGVPHHEDCYQENGGCTVFGCAQAPADDPKLQVSHSDLNAVAAVAQAASTIQSQPAAPANQANLRYGGSPLGLSQPASAAAPVTAPLSQSAQVPSLSAYMQQAHAPSQQPKSRTTYILLGIFLGALGVHNFYAGYTGRAVGQLCLSVFTVFTLALVSWIWAIVEICTVDKDSAGIRFS